MNEIEKLYENAGTCKIKNKKCTAVEYLDCENWHCTSCNKYVTEYPPFTAEKQLELIKWLIKEVDTLQMWYFGPIHNCYDFDLGSKNSTAETFEECIANVINNLWQDLIEEKKEQIRRILNG